MTPWLVVPCPGSRVDELRHCLGSLDHPPERTVIVTAAGFDPLVGHFPQSHHCITVYRPGFSIAALWNFGITTAERHGATEVAVFASDVTGHPGSIPTLAAALRNTGAVMAGPALNGETRILDGPRTCHDRVPGACFMLAAEHGLRCDEAYRWWYGDDQLEVDARKLGPVAVFAGTGLTLSRPDSPLTPERARWAEEDRAYFVEKNGCEPW